MNYGYTVGWVKRSETHRNRSNPMGSGAARLHPSYAYTG